MEENRLKKKKRKGFSSWKLFPTWAFCEQFYQKFSIPNSTNLLFYLTWKGFQFPPLTSERARCDHVCPWIFHRNHSPPRDIPVGRKAICLRGSFIAKMTKFTSAMIANTIPKNSKSLKFPELSFHFLLLPVARNWTDTRNQLYPFNSRLREMACRLTLTWIPIQPSIINLWSISQVERQRFSLISFVGEWMGIKEE